LQHIAESTKDDLISLSGKQGLKLDIPQIPELLIDNTDRNRTSLLLSQVTVLNSVQ
jgi:glutamine synthetase